MLIKKIGYFIGLTILAFGLGLLSFDEHPTVINFLGIVLFVMGGGIVFYNIVITTDKR